MFNTYQKCKKNIQKVNFICIIYMLFALKWWTVNDFTLHPLRITHLYLLVDGLQEFTLMVTYFGMVNLFNELGVFVDKPRLP